MVTNLAVRLLMGLQDLTAGTRDEDGQTVAEYAMIISVVAVGTILLAVTAFRETFVSAFNLASSCLGGSC